MRSHARARGRNDSPGTGSGPLGRRYATRRLNDFLARRPERRAVQRPPQVTTRRVVPQHVAQARHLQSCVDARDAPHGRLHLHRRRRHSLRISLRYLPGAQRITGLVDDPRSRAVIALRAKHDLASVRLVLPSRHPGPREVYRRSDALTGQWPQHIELLRARLTVVRRTASGCEGEAHQGQEGDENLLIPTEERR